MPRAKLNRNDERLIAALRRLRHMAGWTIAEMAEALSLSPQTLRGIMFSKNCAGPQVLGKILEFAISTKSRLGPESPPVIGKLSVLATRMMRSHRRWLITHLWHRVRDDFQSEDELWAFLGAAPDEGRRSAPWEEPDPPLLRAIARAYRAEAQMLNKHGRRGARWCEETAALAERLLTIL